MDSAINKSIHFLFLVLILNLIALAGIVMGLGLFGAIATYRLIYELYIETGSTYDYRLIKYQSIRSKYVTYLKETWLSSFIKILLTFLIIWLMMMTSQIKGILFFASLLVQGMLLVIVLTSFLAEALMHLYFEGSVWEFIKLSFIQFYLAAMPNLINLGYILLMGLLLMFYPALSILFGFSTWVIFIPHYYLKAWRRLAFI